MAVSKIPRSPIDTLTWINVNDQIVDNKISLGTNGFIKYIVKNNICFLMLQNVKIGQIAEPSTMILRGIPFPADSVIYRMDNGQEGRYLTAARIPDTYEGCLRTGINAAMSGYIYGTMSYPISNAWTP